MARLLCALIFSALTAPAVAEDNGVAGFRELFRSVTPKTFDSGGTIARQFHLSPASYLEMATIARTTAARPLREALRKDVANHSIKHQKGKTTLSDYVTSEPHVDAMIVLHEGAIVFEAYPRMAPWQRHFSWSVSKVVIATTLATLVTEGSVDPSLPVTAYVPALKGSSWEGIRLRDVADMASGIDCLDADGYQSADTCIYRLEESLGITAPTGYADGLLAHLKGMKRRGPAAAKNEYVSANTIVLALVIEAVTDQPLATIMQEKLWAPMGAEADGLIAISSEGFTYASAGVTLRLRDLARFGQVVAHPRAFGAIDAAMLASIQTGGIPLQPGYRERLQAEFPDDVPERASWQWDLVWSDGALYKGGYSGQGLYVDPARSLVIAFFGTGEDYSAVNHELRGISRQLAKSGLFPK